MGRLNMRLGQSSGGALTAGQSEVLATMALTSGVVLTSAPVIHKPASVSDFSSRPAGWTPISPVATSALTYADAVTFAAGGMTLKADKQQYMNEDTGFMSSPSGIYLPLHPGLDSLDVTITVDSFSFAGLAVSQYAYVGISLFSLVMGELGGYCTARAWFSVSDATHWFANKRHKRPNDRTVSTSADTAIQVGATPVIGAQTLRLVLANGLRTYQSYLGETELGGGSVATGAVDWTRNDTDPSYDTWGTGPLALVIELGTSGNSSPASSVRVTDLTVA